MTFLCVLCGTWYNEEKNYQDYTVMLMCPECEKEGNSPLWKKERPYFNNYRIFLEILTEIALFIEKEIIPEFEKLSEFKKFEVIK